MMAKMFYTLDEAKAALDKSEEEIKQLAREGRLREFRDGPRLMFKADQVDQLRAELGMGGSSGDQITLGSGDSMAPIGLADSQTGGSMTGSGIGLMDTDPSGRTPAQAPAVPQDDTAVAADLGLSGSLGGIPSPGRPGSSMTGTGMTGSRSGINVLGDTGFHEAADPMAQTAMSSGMGDVNLEGVGSGSGLLDLTRESDDTSLGAELLDEIAPGRTRTGAAPPAEAGVGEEIAAMPSTRRGVAAIYVEARDPWAPAFGGLALGAAAFMLVGFLALAGAVMGIRAPLIEPLFNMGLGANGIWILTGIGFAIAAVFAVVGLIVGKMAR